MECGSSFQNVGGRSADTDTSWTEMPQNTCVSFCVVECVSSNKRFRAAVSVLVGPCCPALLNCIDVDVHTVVLLGKYNDDEPRSAEIAWLPN